MVSPAGLVRGWAARFRRQSLSTKLVAYSTLLTVAAVLVAFLALSVSLNKHTRGLLVETLAHHQETMSNLERADMDELIRTSALVTDSPTLRAAIETFATELEEGEELRPELLATIQVESDRIAARVGRDLLVVTGRDGRVLAASGDPAVTPAQGQDFGVHAIVRSVLEQDQPVGPANFAVLDLPTGHVRVGCVPIVLRGFVIGTLTLGERIDEHYATRLGRTLGCRVLIVGAAGKIASNLSHPVSTQELHRLAGATRVEAELPPVTSLGHEDYVSVRIPLGADGRGGEVSLYLLNSLTEHAADWHRFLLWLLVACGTWAVLVCGTAAWCMSRSVLRPLNDFVQFMRVVAESGDHERRFRLRSSCVEVETLNDAYNHLMNSLLAHERRILENAREELGRLERLKESEKLAALGRTLSGAAHEINNPLTGILGNVELLLRQEDLPQEVRERLERVHREGQRVAELTRNVLKISHRDTGKTSVVDVCQVIRESVNVRRHDFTTAGMRLELNLPEDLIRVKGRELELSQVFLNIVNNAYDALQDGGPFGCLNVGAAIEGGRVVITFSDNGPGMKDPKQVFEHFYTTKPVGQGTGLGLGICHAIIQGHGGQIRAENLAGGGARFIIELPHALAVEALKQPVEPTAESSLDAGPLDATVLVVDDEPTIVDLQREILESLGASVVAVASGNAAIEQLRQRSFDLIVSDLRMPGTVSGLDLYRWLKSNHPEALRGFMFMTGDTVGDGNDFIRNVGARYLMKPFNTKDYVRMLRETLHGARNPG